MAVLLCCAGVLRAEPCTINDLPVLSLFVTAAEVRGSDRTLSVQVGQDGCVAVHRPAHYKAAGDYRLMLSSTELAGLSAKLSPAARALDDRALAVLLNRSEAVRIEARATATGATSSAVRVERFTVEDADRYVIETRATSAAQTTSKLSWDGLPAYAEFYPEVAALQEFAALSAALQVLAMRSDAVQTSGAPR